ncbi:transcription factor RFX3-like [Watersipora subatra]|uniref:transcription factor RFX3-like n=1 Tax=Watersipora subatra TaxID=2589382 RepID=UPI00355C1222
MEDPSKTFTPNPPKKILVANSGSVAGGKQFVVTQSKGTTIIQPAVVHGSSNSAQQPQYIVTAVGSGSHSSQAQGGSEHSSTYGQSISVQYGDNSNRHGSTPDNIVYTGTTPSGSTVQYQYGEGYSSPAAHYTTFNTASSQFQGSGETAQHLGQTFFLQGGTLDGEGYPLAHTTRAAPATVKWLLENFEPCDGVSLPRSVLYNFYLHHCGSENVEPSNPASFGKLVRMIFRDLKTRRLGQRGNSRYHYYGIRLKPNSTLNQLMPDETPVAIRQPTHPTRRVRPAASDDGTADSNPVTPKSEPLSVASETVTSSAEDKHRQYLGSAIDAIPHNVTLVIDAASMPEGLTQRDFDVFKSLYIGHCEAILELVIDLKFNEIESHWQQFWRKSASMTPSLEAKLPKENLFMMSRVTEVQIFIKQMDYQFYQSLTEVLIPDVLRPIPGALTQTLRNFAKSLEGWLRSALVGAPDVILKTKLTALTAFSQTLRRYTSLNHLAQAARAVLTNSTQIQQMMTDLARVNFSHIQEQSAWVCQCPDSMVSKVEGSFKRFLQGEHTLEEWRDWLENILDDVLSGYEGLDTYSKAARNFLLKWSFYSSMVIRDLTLRSAASFGSFHLIRLLYDEYMFYLVEHKVAAVTSRTPIAVMSQLIENNDQIRMASQAVSAASVNSMFNSDGVRSIVGPSGDDIFASKRCKVDTDPLGVAMNTLK